MHQVWEALCLVESVLFFTGSLSGSLSSAGGACVQRSRFQKESCRCGVYVTLCCWYAVLLLQPPTLPYARPHSQRSLQSHVTHHHRNLSMPTHLSVPSSLFHSQTNAQVDREKTFEVKAVGESCRLTVEICRRHVLVPTFSSIPPLPLHLSLPLCLSCMNTHDRAPKP